MITRRAVLKFAGIAGAAAALEGALRMEGALAAGETTGTPPQAAVALPFALTTPAHIDAAALRVRDLATVSAYYRQVLGLEIIARTADGEVLGAGGVPLLHLIHAPAAPGPEPGSAGLFHVAYLMPSREDLARWLVHAARIDVPVDGLADHNVSEAIYLSDPEGNGIEVYADRPRASWQWRDGVVTMGTQALDVDAIVALTDRSVDSYRAAPAGLRIGHVHLRVGEVEAARGFYQTALGLDATRPQRPDAAFLSSGGYHHHVAVNSWQSLGAPMRQPGELGLDWFAMKVGDFRLYAGQRARLASLGTVTETAGGIEARDPWGTTVRLRPA